MSKFHNREEKKNRCISSQRKELKSGFKTFTDKTGTFAYFVSIFYTEFKWKLCRSWVRNWKASITMQM